MMLMKKTNDVIYEPLMSFATSLSELVDMSHLRTYVT